MDYQKDLTTPRFSDHARQRCQEMGISTKVAKRIWQTRMVTRPLRGQAPRVVVASTVEPDYKLVVDPTGWYGDGGPPVVVTVLFNCYDPYIREGATYTVIRKKKW